MRREKRKRKRKRWKDLSLFWVKPISFQNLYLSHLLIDMAREIVSSLIAKMRNIGVRVDAESVIVWYNYDTTPVLDCSFLLSCFKSCFPVYKSSQWCGNVQSSLNAAICFMH